MWIIILGYTILFIGSAFFLIPGLPEIVEVMARLENLDPTSETLNDKASGIYNGFYSLGSISAPIIGGALTDSIGYRSANDIMAFIALAFFIIYAFTNTRPKHYKCKR